MPKYDFVAIGGGNAGLTAASRIAAAGHKVALIDRGPVGGLCSLNGCNPKKVLVRATEVLEEVRHASKYGIETGSARIDWSKVIDRKESFTSPVTPAAEQSLKDQGIDLIQGAPRFTGRSQLQVNGTTVDAGGFVIATGSYPRPLDFPGAELTGISNDFLALRKVPENFVIIGAGVIAFEFGQIFARLGSRVTVITPGKRALSGHDEDLVQAVVDFSCRQLGMKLITEASFKCVCRNGGRLAVEFMASGQERRLDADFVLNAAGRIASIGDLDLGKAGVETDKRGVVVNDFLRSVSNPDIFAAGDAHGRMQLSPVASYEGRVVARNFLEGDAERVDYEAIPRALYTIPPMASVGLTEAEARKRGLNIAVNTSDMTNWKVYAILGEPIAKAKIITDAVTGKIVGAHLYGGAAGDQIHTFALAMKFGIPAGELKNFVYAYPTLSSALPYTMG